ncbi:histidine kinase [Moniliophthora roreri MCA 2997]|uniref:histidine kinase n=1 Tax=Moniliophthora roreri (strain MCA 2997) TaxID=1381753 RepID=V2WX59_MONRO|nr:histidine kinase [Moniliophthora roreri MCA 2997]
MFTSDSLPLFHVSSKRRLRVDFEDTREPRSMWAKFGDSVRKAWHFAIHAPGSSPSDGMGDGTESTTSTSAFVESQKQLVAENNGDDWRVDEVVVTGETDHVVRGSERTTSGASPAHSDTQSIDEDRRGSPHSSGGYHPPSIRTRILNIWVIVYTFFDASFDDKQTEHEFRKLNWYSTKSFAFYASLYLVLNWALYLGLNNDSTKGSDYAMGVYYGGLTFLTIPLPFFVAFNLPLHYPVFFQIWFTLAVWWCGVTELIQIRICRFYDPGGRQNCGGKDFLAMLYYVTALPTLMLFLMSHRFPTLIMMVIVFILIGALIIPVQAIFARNMISFALFSGFLLGLHHNKEMADRRLFLLNTQLKVAYKAQQKAQQAQSRASQAKRRFASYIFHEVRVPLNNAAIAFNNLVTNDAFKNFTTNSAFYHLTTTSAYGNMTGNESAFAKEAPHPDAEDAVALQVSLTQVQQVLNDSLDLDKMDAGHFDINPRPFPLHSVMRSTLAPLIVTAVNKNLQLKLNLDERIDQLGPRFNTKSGEVPVPNGNTRAEDRPPPTPRPQPQADVYPSTPGSGFLATPSSWSGPSVEAKDYISYVPRLKRAHSASSAHSPKSGFESIIRKHKRTSSSVSLEVLPQSPSTTAAAPGPITESPLRGADELWVIGDEVRLRQVLTNLVSNAVKFTPAGAAEGITVSTELLTVTEGTASEHSAQPGLGSRKGSKEGKQSTEGDHSEKDAKQNQKPTHDTLVFRIEICDSGPGIKPSDLVDYQLFQPFAQTKVGKLSKNSSGLGLAIVRQIVTLSGGKLGVRSARSKGAAFWVELSYPIARQRDLQILTDVNLTSSLPDFSPKPVPVDEAERWPTVAFAEDVKPPMITGAVASQAFLPPPPPGPQHQLSGSTLVSGSGGQASGWDSKIPTQSPSEDNGAGSDSPTVPPPISMVLGDQLLPEHGTTKSTSDMGPSAEVPASSDHAVRPDAMKGSNKSTRKSIGVEEPGPPSPIASPASPPVPPDETPITLNVVDTEPPKPKKAKKALPPANGHPLALIVEDNLVTRNVMSRYLQRRGYVVHTAEDGRECLEMVLGDDAPEYDFISMDNDMPSMTGEDAVREIRRAGKNDLFIVGVTGSALSEDQRNFLAAGVNLVVTKPFNPGNFDKIIAQRKNMFTSRSQKSSSHS